MTSSQPPLKVLGKKSGVVDVQPFVPEKAECDLPLEERIRRAQSKIKEAAALDANSILCYMNMAYQLGSFARQLRVAAFAPQPASDEMPSGFALHVSPNAPVLMTSFLDLTLFNGLMAVPLPSSTRQLSLNLFADRQRNFLGRLCRELSDEHDLGLGEPSNFVGFFYDAVESQFYCVAQCHSTALALEATRIVMDAEPLSLADADDCARRSVEAANQARQRMHTVANYEVSIDINNITRSSSSTSASTTKKGTGYTTWDALFTKNPRMIEIRRAMREHRLNVIRKACKIIGLDLTCSLEAPEIIDTTFNVVDQVDLKEASSDRVLLNGMASIHQISRAGSLYVELPKVWLLRGPWETERVARQNAEHPLTPFIGVPVTSGRRKTLALLESEQVNDDWKRNETLLPDEVHSWPDGEANLLFDINNNRKRSLDAKFIEQCGHKPGKELPLTPVCVRWARPTSARRG
jgi:hypothetical protein